VSGKIHRLIQELVQLRSKGRTEMTHFVRAHLMLSGIDPDQFTETSPDDPEVIARLQRMIADFRRTR
jgi:hypothetical protein